MFFETAIDELLFVEQLLELEKDEEQKIFQQEVLSKSLDERRKLGFTWYPIIIKEDFSQSGMGNYFEIKRTTNQNIPHSFQAGQIVSVFSNQEKKENPSVKAIIKLTHRDTITVVITADDLPDWWDEGKLGVELFFDETTFSAMGEALKTVIKAESNRLSQLREILAGKSPAKFKQFDKQFINLPGLNESQNRAIQMVLAAEDAIVIHGPPGTGKTTTLVEAIKLIVKDEKQTLVVAPSNMAADLLVEKLANDVKVLRLGHPVRISQSVRKHTLDAKISTHHLYSQLRALKKRSEETRVHALKYKRNYVKGERSDLLKESRDLRREAGDIQDFITNDIITDTSVFIATPVYVNSEILRKKRFKTVFIDEAAQMLEPASWIAIIKADRVVFAGDHCQLPPTIKSIKAQKNGLDQTLFEKFYGRQLELGINESSQLLDTQYRMRSEIMEFSNQIFYQGKLIADKSVHNRLLIGEDIIHPINFPVEFIDIAGCGFDEKLNEEMISLYNPDEAGILLNHLLDLTSYILHHNTTEDQFKIGVISPYKAQTNLLKDLICQEPILNFDNPKILVDTIDGFQGQECDVIYISLVRSNDKNEIGFLKDTRRMNVAMTRAKKKLVLIGDSSTISIHPFYEMFMDYVNRIDAYKSAWEFMK